MIQDIEVWNPLQYSTARRYCDALSRMINWLNANDLLRDSTRPFETDKELTVYAIENIKDTQLYTYLKQCLDHGYRTEYLKVEIAAIKWVHKNISNIPRSWSRSESLLKNTESENFKQLNGIDWNAVEDLCDHIASEKSMSSYRDIALIRVMSDCLLRVSEVIKIDVDDIRGLTLKFGDIRLNIGEKTKKAIDQYKKVADIKDGPLFRPNGKGFALRNERIGQSGVRSAIKRRTKEVGLDTHLVGNSFRIGSIKSLLAAGASLEDVRKLSRHKTANSILRYVSRDDTISNPSYNMLNYRYGVQQ